MVTERPSRLVVEIDGERVLMTAAQIQRSMRSTARDRKSRRGSGGSKTRDDFLELLVREHGFALEVPFAGASGEREYRWDACKGRVAVEYSGIGPGHRWTKGVTRDYRKIGEGQLCGYTVIVCNHEMVNDGSCLQMVEEALRGAE